MYESDMDRMEAAAEREFRVYQNQLTDELTEADHAE